MHRLNGGHALQFSHSGIFASAARPCSSGTTAPCHQKLRHGALASNKPHPAEKSTPVWLAIWYPGPDLLTRSFGVQPFIAPIHISARLPCCHLGAAAQTDANLSAHLRRLPTPPPYLRRMRLSPGRWRRFLIGDMAAVWLGCCSSNSPRARILVLGTSGAHWPARWPQFELTERVAKS